MYENLQMYKKNVPDTLHQFVMNCYELYPCKNDYKFPKYYLDNQKLAMS